MGSRAAAPAPWQARLPVLYSVVAVAARRRKRGEPAVCAALCVAVLSSQDRRRRFNAVGRPGRSPGALGSCPKGPTGWWGPSEGLRDLGRRRRVCSGAAAALYRIPRQSWPPRARLRAPLHLRRRPWPSRPRSPRAGVGASECAARVSGGLGRPPWTSGGVSTCQSGPPKSPDWTTRPSEMHPRRAMPCSPATSTGRPRRTAPPHEDWPLPLW
eukprot:scaffold998_cov411-Prasinococcus_capsulatus_cf.AAC.20